MGQSEPNDGILSEEIIDKLRAAVLAECGIALNRDDPVFSTVILNKIILDGYIQQVVEALSAISKDMIETNKTERSYAQVTQTPQNQSEPPDGIEKALHHNRTKLLEELLPVIEEKMAELRQTTPKLILELTLISLVVGAISLATNILFHSYIAGTP